MGKQPQTRERETADPIFTAVRSDRRRSLLTLLARTPEMSERELARTITTVEHGASDETPTEAVENTRLDLHHIQLPLLEDTGFIEWERDDESITTTDHVALEDPRFQRLLRTEVPGIDDVLAELADTRQRLVLAVLRDENAPVSRTALAREVIRRENDGTDPTQAAVDATAIALHHKQLPTLSDAGIIDYDVETGRATYTNHPAVEELITILQKPDSRLIKRLNGFLEGLQTSYNQATESANDPFSTPSIWRAPYE
jgi:hypothetical protein